ncbi:MAG: alpha-N-acetylglucosaminidase [Bacteroidetes bacterium]|nr:alpha-N-acetylglucosaminidase [Bacteroidota bacterium]
MKNLFLILFVLIQCNCIAEESSALKKLLSRIAPELENKIDFILFEKENDDDTFSIENKSGGITISGTSNSSLAYGLNYYLQHYLKKYYSRIGYSIEECKEIVSLDSSVTKTTSLALRYSLNYCTFNYSMSFWGWEKWDKELDWMALHGVNLSLAVVGTEAVWQNTLRRFGFIEEEIIDFIPGPAFTAWWLMNNLEGWGGPVSQGWINSRVELQKKILARMKELGIEPVLQGFYGMVPFKMIEEFPDANIVDTGKWVEFQRSAFILPEDPMFKQIATVYYQEMEKLYGKQKYYGGDPFHEDEHDSFQNVDLRKSGKLIQECMIKDNPDATWVLQGWWKNPTDEMLSGLKKENTLILDLWSDYSPAWEKRNGFGELPWVWNCLQNFGDKVGMFGRLKHYASEFNRARKSDFGNSLVGIGTVMEGFSSNQVTYDLLFDLAWQSGKLDVEEWLSKHVEYRYGLRDSSAINAWRILLNTVYATPLDQEQGNESIFCARPSLDGSKVNMWGSTGYNYNNEELLRALSALLGASPKIKLNDIYRYDLVNIMCQYLANLGLEYHGKMISDYEKGDIAAFDLSSKKFLNLILDQNQLLGTRNEFRLSEWIYDARKSAANQTEEDLFEWNARTLVTLWGKKEPSMELHEYSHREWSGLLSDFYYPRWEMFVEHLSGKLLGEQLEDIDWYKVEYEWTQKTNFIEDIIEVNEEAIINKHIKKYGVL